MGNNVFNILKERDFINQVTHEIELLDYLKNNPITCYVGFDPTAPSLHVGNLVPIMALAHMNRNEHNAIAVIGGSTGLIGDPSGKNKTRKSLSLDEVNINLINIKKQLINFTKFKSKKLLVLNNAEWLSNIDYISFIRDIGKYFSVNRMLKAESCKNRLSSSEGLSFLEFNYMLLQAYDFNKLYENYNCRLQLGGSDQWGNIVAGIDLVRRKNQSTVFGVTFPLITNSNGVKMGKTVDGAIWLDSSMTSPYDYYQFWINTSDMDLQRFMALFTFLPLEEIVKIGSLNEKEINQAKHILAFEATCIAHGKEIAIQAHQASIKVFGGKTIPKNILPSSDIPREPINILDDSSIPSIKIDKERFSKIGIPMFKLFKLAGLSQSSSSACRLIQQGGGYINGDRIKDPNHLITTKDIFDRHVLLRSGKKRFVKIKIIESIS